MANISGPGINVSYTYDADEKRVKEEAGGVARQFLVDPLLPFGQAPCEPSKPEDYDFSSYFNVPGIVMVPEACGGPSRFRFTPPVRRPNWGR